MEILRLMIEPVLRSQDSVKQEVSKRCQALASFMETLMSEVTKPALKIDLPPESDLEVSERDSVMLGEISPHHEYYDSKSSSETLPSYNQLNYNKNLQRFFNSKPSTVGLDMEKPTSSNATNSHSPIMQKSSGSGDSGTGGRRSSGSECQLDGDNQNDASLLSNLTEAQLLRHNDDMEKTLIKEHRESRSNKTGKNQNVSYFFSISFVIIKQNKNLGEKNKKGTDKNQETLFGHGVKRSVSKSWDDDGNKNSKHHHASDSRKYTKINVNFVQDTIQGTTSDVNHLQTDRSNDLYSHQPPSATSPINQFNTQSAIFPAVYLMPTQFNNMAQDFQAPTSLSATINHPPSYTMPFMSGFMQPFMYGQQYMYPPPFQMMYPPLPFHFQSSYVGLVDQNIQNAIESVSVSLE